MPLNEAALNVGANAIAGVITHVALHTGTTSGSEISGGSPAYERRSITWAGAAGGNSDSSNVPLFNVPGGVTIAYIGYWSAASGGTFYGTSAITPETYGAQGTYELDDADITLTVPGT